MRANRKILSTILVSLLLAGCAGEASDGSPGREGAGNGSAAPGSADADPVTLIGSWTVEEAAQEEPGAILRIAPRDLSLRRGCGALAGAWRADAAGLFVADLRRGSGCPVLEEPTPRWLRDATSFRTAGDDRLLFDRQGDVVARLLPGGGADTLPSEAEPPVVTEKVRRAFPATAPLPAGLTAPPTPEALVGRWVPALDSAGSPEPVYIELLADGAWRGSDGCNAQGGRWISGGGGSLLATAGVSTLVACDNVPVAQWLNQAWRAGLDGEILVLLDAEGTEIGRVKPAG
jgi:hypothetical protein